MMERPQRPQTAPAARRPSVPAALSSGSIVVGVRVRPLTVAEQYGSQRSLIRIVDDKVLCFDPACDEDMHIGKAVRGPRKIGHRAAKDQKYAFDCVFDTNATQEQVYQKTARPQIESVLSGYNATVFAYGATGAGKTHTMIGDRVTGPGVMVLAMEDLFAAIESTKLDSAYELSLSYLEVYNETIRDLLAPEAHATAPVEGAPPPPAALDAAGGATPRVRPTGPTGGLTLREDPHGGIQVTGLSRHSPNSADQVLELLQRGNGNRAMSATHANAVSSRSHAVLQITVRETAKTADVTADVRVGKLSLIDLAGSERASVTANRGVQLHEGANINKSLLALSNCINALGKAKGDLRHIPYRDSKLTRLLKDSLGGNCKTTMIAAVSPSRASYEDTLNTLKYANRAKEIKLLASQNSVKVDFHIAKYAQIIAQLREEVGVWRGKHAQAVAGLAPAAALAQQPDGGLAPPSAGALAAAAAAVDRQRGQAAYSRIEQTYSVAANALQHLAELRLREREAADALASAKEATAFADAKLGEARALADADAHAASPAALLRAEADAESALEGVARAQASSAKYAQMRKRLHATLSEAYAAFDKLDRALSEPAADGDDDAPPSADGGGGGAEGASLYVRSEERRALLQQEIRCRVLQLRNLDLTAKLRVQQPQPVAPPALQPAPSQPQSESVVVAELWALVRAQSDLLEQSQLSTPTLAAAYAEAARRCAAVEPTAGSSSACAGLADADDLSLRLSLNAETRAHVQDAPGATPQGLAAADVEHTYAFGSSSASKEKLLASRAAPIPSPAVRRSIGKIFSPSQHAPSQHAPSQPAPPAQASRRGSADDGAARAKPPAAAAAQRPPQPAASRALAQQPPPQRPLTAGAADGGAAGRLPTWAEAVGAPAAKGSNPTDHADGAQPLSTSLTSYSSLGAAKRLPANASGGAGGPARSVPSLNLGRIAEQQQPATRAGAPRASADGNAENAPKPSGGADKAQPDKTAVFSRLFSNSTASLAAAQRQKYVAPSDGAQTARAPLGDANRAVGAPAGGLGANRPQTANGAQTARATARATMPVGAKRPTSAQLGVAADPEAAGGARRLASSRWM